MELGDALVDELEHLLGSDRGSHEGVRLGVFLEPVESRRRKLCWIVH